MPESHFVVQIDTTFNRPQTRAYQRFQQFYPLFNRTLLNAYVFEHNSQIDFRT